MLDEIQKLEWQVATKVEVSYPKWEMLPNMSLSWHRGKESVLEVLERHMDENYYGRGPYGFLKDHDWKYVYRYDYEGQIPEEYYTRAWMLASQYAWEHKDRWVHFVRQDCETEVPETLDNAPYRQVNGQMVKATEQWLLDNNFLDTNRGWISS